MPTEITFIFRKFEGYIPSGIGARSVPVSRLADENVILFEIFKILWWAKFVAFDLFERRYRIAGFFQGGKISQISRIDCHS